jgi:hypothetical protein
VLRALQDGQQVAAFWIDSVGDLSAVVLDSNRNPPDFLLESLSENKIAYSKLSAVMQGARSGAQRNAVISCMTLTDGVRGAKRSGSVCLPASPSRDLL